MKNFIIIVISLLTCMLTNQVQARDGIYIDLDTGWANQTGLPNKEQTGALNIDSKNSPIGHAAVGYNHDVNHCFGLGFEIGYGKFGKQTYHFPDRVNSSVQSRSLEFLFASQFHLINQFDILGKVGGIRQTMSLSGFNRDDQTQIRPEVGLGGAFNFTPHLAGTLTYAHVFGQQISDLANVGRSTPSLNEVLIGIRGTF